MASEKTTKADPVVANVAPLRKPVACPKCGAPSLRDTYPFCSKRCADLDLGAWLSDRYAIPGASGGDDNQVE